MSSSAVLFSSWAGSVVDNRGKGPQEYEPAVGLEFAQSFSETQEIKALAGWKGLVIRSEGVDIVDLCRAHLEAVREESKKCDKCNYCSTGYNELLDVFQDLLNGDASEEDLEFLESAAEAIREAGKCSIGKTGPIPLLHALRFFREDFLKVLRGEKKSKSSKLLFPAHGPLHASLPYPSGRAQVRGKDKGGQVCRIPGRDCRKAALAGRSGKGLFSTL